MAQPPPTRTITFRRIGNSIGATFPKDVVDRMGIEERSEWHLVETPEGLLLKRFDRDFEEAMAAYREGAERYKNALRELAK